MCNSKIAELSYSQLENMCNELTRLRIENLQLQYQIAETEAKVRQAKALAEIENRVYSGIKKLFR